MAKLTGQVALVTGASRGVPKGVALGLGEAGMTVYVTGRTIFLKEKGFWTIPLSRWDKSFDAGVRAQYVASVFATQRMIRQGQGLIVNISSFGAVDIKAGVIYGVAKNAADRMTALSGPV